MIQASKAGFLFKSTDAINLNIRRFRHMKLTNELYDAIGKIKDNIQELNSFKNPDESAFFIES